MPFLAKKSSKRLILLIAAFALCTVILLALANQQSLNYESPLTMTQWNLNNNKNLPTAKNDSKALQRILEKYNDEQTILNEDKYGPVQNNDTIVIVIQVHKRIQYLRHLIESLAKAKDISKTLLIFSHDFFDDEMNELVQGIDFCRVLQIFYPYSIQAYENAFPGTDPNDCNRDMTKKEALKVKCINAHFPDKYGHYREASYTQMKHHFWWKLNRIFDEINVTKNLSNFYLLLLEEDYYLSPDFLTVFNQLVPLASRKCPYCNVMSLGSYSNENMIMDNYDKIEISPWLTSKHNMGFSFNRTTWNEIKSCAKFFCAYDEYNYDWSLQNINYNCLQNKLYAIIVKAPRVFHIGQCGMHHHNSINCDSSEILSRISSVIDLAADAGKLFPKKLKVTKIYNDYEVSDTLNNNGGWGDLRDQILCLNMTTLNFK